MKDYSHPLGDAVKRAREEKKLTQVQVAEAVKIDVRTVMNIENYKANPKMMVLYPLIRFLNIDSRDIFNSELHRDSPNLQKLRLMVEDCSEEEAGDMIRIFETVLTVLRSKNTNNVE